MNLARESRTPCLPGWSLGAAIACCMAASPSGAAPQTGQPVVGSVPIAQVVSRMSRDSGLTVLTAPTLKINVPPLKTVTTAANVEKQIAALVKALPPGTIWGKLSLPEPRPNRPYKGDDVAVFAYASGQLF